MGCSLADTLLDGLGFGTTKAQQMAFLEECIFFHHFMAIEAAYYIIPDFESQRTFCNRMMAVIPKGTIPGVDESVDLTRSKIFTDEDREAAIKACFFSFANIKASMTQDLYLRRKPNETELEVMSQYSVRQMTGWDSDTANTVQFFTAALMARLAIALAPKYCERTFEYLKLSFSAVAESMAAFDLYTGLLGGEVVTKGSDVQTQRAPEAKGTWISRLFK